MKKNLMLVAALLLCGNFLFAQRLSEYQSYETQHNWFSWPCTGPFPTAGCKDKERQIQTEYPPYIIGGGWRTYVFTDGSNSSIASHPSGMIGLGELNFKNNGSSPVRIVERSENYMWKRNYFCAYSAQYVTHPTAGTISMAFAEGENYHQPSTGPASPCAWMEGNAATTYLSMAWIPNTEATNWGHQEFADMGPIIWPATGYFMPNGTKSSVGCANNTTIQADGYMYVFYKDQSCWDLGLQMGPGRLPGIKVARAPIADALNPLAYKTFYEDANGIHWNQSLPAGFNKDYIQNYLTTMGPLGTTILGTDRDYTRFAVAKVAGTNYYLGVGNYPDPVTNQQVVTLKYSNDLVHWYGDREVYRASSYLTSHFNYSIFLSADGWSNTYIDETNFYIIGTSPEANGVNNVTYKLRVHIPPPPQSYPIECWWYMNVPSENSGLTVGDVDVTGNKLTVEAIYNIQAGFGHSTAGGDIVSKHCSSSDANYFLRPQAAGITTTDGYFTVESPCDVEPYLTNHVAMVYDGATLSLYRNGKLDASVPATGDLITNDYQTTIGTEACSSNWWQPIHFLGYIGEVRIWMEARTSQQIYQYRNQTIPTPVTNPNLLSYFTLAHTGNAGSYPQHGSLFGSASVAQTNPVCTQETLSCTGFARKSTGTTKEQAPADKDANSIVLYPNPASKSATLVYAGKTSGTITINVVDVTGKMVKVMRKPVTMGKNTITIDINNLSNGIYSVQLIDGNKTTTKKLVVRK
jgi:hypothetical protein